MTTGFFHATDADLTGQTHLLPPTITGVEPTWDGMDSSELALVFLTDTIDAARGWGAEIAGMAGLPFTVYRVDPEAPVASGPPGMYATHRARIIEAVFSFDPNDE